MLQARLNNAHSTLCSRSGRKIETTLKKVMCSCIDIPVVSKNSQRYDVRLYMPDFSNGFGVLVLE